MAGWHHQLDGHDFEQLLGDGEGQGSLVCYESMGSLFTYLVYIRFLKNYLPTCKNQRL